MPQYYFVAAYNDARSRKLAVAHVTRAKSSGVAYEAIDLGRIYHERRGICGICRLPVPFAVFGVDHIRPLSKGGPHLPWNIQIAHVACNSSKSNRLPAGFVD